MYEYKATVLRVVDGDTVDCRIDLGWNTFLEGKVRLYGINAPELSTPEGQDAKAFLETRMPVGGVFTLNSYKDKREKYGRFLGEFWVFGSVGGDSINHQMLHAGKAVRYVP